MTIHFYTASSLDGFIATPEHSRLFGHSVGVMG